MQKQDSYNNIIKGTALFGGVQIFNILINLIRGKLIALILGPQGMGINSLLSTSANAIQQTSSLGINLASVKEISSAQKEKDLANIQACIITVRRLLYLTASIGALFTIIFSKKLSIWTFEDPQYSLYFVLLSIMIFFTTLSNGELSILQGIQAIKKIAFASIIGSSVGLFIGVPLYYLYNYDGIVPAMIALSIATFIFYRYHTHKIIKIDRNLSWKDMHPIAKKMISLGIISMLSIMLGTLTNYALNIIITRTGSINDLGFFQSANSITNQYVGLVFSAMAMDYFPRLSAVSSDNSKVRELANQQIEIVLLIIAPLVSIFILISPILVIILLSSKFLSIIPLLRYMSLGIIFKAISFPMGYISFAKGDKKVFFWLEGVWGSLFIFSMNIIFYNLEGINGLGKSYTIVYAIGCIIYILLLRKLYHFYCFKETLILIGKILILILATFTLSLIGDNIYIHIGMTCSVAFTLIYCLQELNKRTNIINAVTRKFKRH